MPVTLKKSVISRNISGWNTKDPDADQASTLEEEFPDGLGLKVELGNVGCFQSSQVEQLRAYVHRYGYLLLENCRSDEVQLMKQLGISQPTNAGNTTFAFHQHSERISADEVVLAPMIMIAYPLQAAEIRDCATGLVPASFYNTAQVFPESEFSYPWQALEGYQRYLSTEDISGDMRKRLAYALTLNAHNSRVIQEGQELYAQALSNILGGILHMYFLRRGQALFIDNRKMHHCAAGLSSFQQADVPATGRIYTRDISPFDDELARFQQLLSFIL